MHAPRRSPHAARPMRGAATVEFAILSMVLITVVLGAVEYGRAILCYDALVKAVRSAARHASNHVETEAVKAAAQHLVVYNQTTAGTAGTETVPGLTPSNVTVVYESHDSISNKVTVTVSGVQFVPMASWVLPAFPFGPVTAVMTQAR